MQFKTLLTIGLLLILLLSIIPTVSAIYEVTQGDTLYLGETVDISRVMSWSGQFAYFTNGEPGDYPAKIVDVNDVGHMYNYYIDPTKYNVGTWYKWDGKEESSGNMLAFYIASGVRNNTYISQLNHGTTSSITPLPTQTPTLPATIPQNTHLLLARGDQGVLKYGLSYGQYNGNNQQGYIWLFGNVPDYDLTQGSLMTSGTLLGIPMNYTSGDSVNSFTFTPEISRNLQEGWYNGYIQYAGQNGIQDVFYKSEHKVKDDYVSILETPYDDDLVPDVPLDGFIPVRIQQEFEKLEQPSKYCDDILVPISVEVVTPTISIGDYWEESDNLIIRGSTPMSAGTIISVMLDPNQYVTFPEIKSHTFKTKAVFKVDDGITLKEATCIETITDLNNDGYNVTQYNGTAMNTIFFNGTKVQTNLTPIVRSSKIKCTSVPRVYSISIPIQWKDMAIGHHQIYAYIDSFGVQTSMYKDIDVSGEWVNPTPTKEFNKLIVVREGGSHLINRENGTNVNSTGFPNQITVTPTQPADIIIFGNQTDNQTIEKNITIKATVIPTPKKTPVPLPTTAKQDSQANNPLLWLLAILVIIAIIAAWLFWG